MQCNGSSDSLISHAQWSKAALQRQCRVFSRVQWDQSKMTVSMTILSSYLLLLCCRTRSEDVSPAD